MAVRIDLAALRRAVDSGTYRDAEDLLAAGRLGEITPVGGGAAAVVNAGTDIPLQVWVGVVAGGLETECDCAGPGHDPEDLCAHAVALTIAALRDDFSWSSAAVPPSG
ncbi:MAG TPA: hypothetical protein VFX60_09685 [Micromonospora sp.]|nr:hypothetical protein [Micromonospora sp.]